MGGSNPGVALPLTVKSGIGGIFQTLLENSTQYVDTQRKRMLIRKIETSKLITSWVCEKKTSTQEFISWINIQLVLLDSVLIMVNDITYSEVF